MVVPISPAAFTNSSSVEKIEPIKKQYVLRNSKLEIFYIVYASIPGLYSEGLYGLKTSFASIPLVNRMESKRTNKKQFNIFFFPKVLMLNLTCSNFTIVLSTEIVWRYYRRFLDVRRRDMYASSRRRAEIAYTSSKCIETMQIIAKPLE